MQKPEEFGLSLWDYRDDLQWVNLLGWTEDELRSVPVHEEATAGQDYLNLSNFGGTSLGVIKTMGSGTSAAATNIRNIFVYSGDTPQKLYKQLEELVARGGPSGYEESGKFGEVGETTEFPPS